MLGQQGGGPMNIFDSHKMSLSGHNLIEASAGTGKTYAIASLYIRLVVERNMEPESILVVTFTEAATKELRDRIRARLAEARDVFSGVKPTKDSFLLGLQSETNLEWPGAEEACERLERALQQFDCASIYTIHGFCSRMLLDYAFESGSLYDTELVAEQTGIIQTLTEDFWRRSFFDGDAELLPLAESDERMQSPEALAKFLKGLVCNEEVIVVPDVGEEKVKTVDAACHEVYLQVCTAWLAQRAGICGLLLDEQTRLSRSEKTYRSDVLEELFDQMDCYVSGGNPYTLFSGIVKFTPAVLENSMLKGAAAPEHMIFPLCAELVDLVEERKTALLWQIYAYVRGELPEVKSSRNIRFYNDLLSDLDASLSGTHGDILADRIRGRFSAALIDEFQDTDQVQYRIFSKVFSADKAVMCLIGDPKQAIYSFRGADIYAYLKAKKYVPDGNRFTMDMNWRSVPLMVEAVNHLFTFKGASRPLVIKDLEYPDVKAARSEIPLQLDDRDAAPLQMWFFKKDDKDRGVISLTRGEPRVVAAVGEEIAQLLADAAAGKARINDEPLAPSDIAVVVRSHKEATWIYDDLNRRRIPAVVRSNASIFSSAEAAELAHVLAAVTEPTREKTLRRAMITSLFGMNGNDIAATLEPGGAEAWTCRMSNFRDYHDLWRERGFMAMFRAMMEREGIRGRLLSRPGGERAVTNLLHCGEVLHSEETTSCFGMDALYTWFSECIESPPEGEEHQIRLESDEKAVKILTIHVSKGLEFPIVFCPFSWRGAYVGDNFVTCHDDDYTWVADFGSDEFDKHRVSGLEEALAENARVLYVALTRAKYRLYVAWGKFFGSQTSAMGYLLHRPDDDGAGDLVANLEQTIGSLDEKQIKECLESLSNAKHGCICMTEDPEGGDTLYEQRPVDTDRKLSCRTVEAVIETDWKVSSFTSLTGGHKDAAELPDYDEQAGAGDTPPETPAPEGSIFAFPRGAMAGTFMHSVLEKVDFTKADSETVKDLVTKQIGDSLFKETKGNWIPAISGMIRNVVEADLGDGLRLSGLKPKSWVPEMEFFFPLRFVGSKRVAEVLRLYGGHGDDLARLADTLYFREQRGMVRGFVDLVFSHDDRYYILDWKSNHLGNSPEDYGQDRLAREMARNLYTMQHLLYTVALNRYLEKRQPGYSYEQNFGGAYYLFLRGIDARFPGNGIYHYLPAPGLVRDLTACLIDCEGA